MHMCSMIRKKEEKTIAVEKKYEELGITDAFMFSKVMRDEKICRQIMWETYRKGHGITRAS